MALLNPRQAPAGGIAPGQAVLHPRREWERAGPQAQLSWNSAGKHQSHGQRLDPDAGNCTSRSQRLTFKIAQALREDQRARLLPYYAVRRRQVANERK
jgi:hypothetical protein